MVKGQINLIRVKIILEEITPKYSYLNKTIQMRRKRIMSFYMKSYFIIWPTFVEADYSGKNKKWRHKDAMKKI